MPGEVNCVFTKGLIPWVERESGPEGVQAIVRAAGRSREWLMADHNWISLDLADRLAHVAMEVMGEADEARWARRFGEDFMNWKPREERSYLGTYSMGIGSPRGVYERLAVIFHGQMRFRRLETLALGRSRAVFRFTPLPGYRVPLWACEWWKVAIERFPTNWGLPRARLVERQCAARGADSCLYEVAWRNPPLGASFWTAAGAGVLGSVLAWLGLGATGAVPWAAAAPLGALTLLLGGALGWGLLQRRRHHHTRRLLDLQSEEIIYSNSELERKFADLDSRIEQLSVLSELAAAVGATLDPERIYEQALERLVRRLGYEAVYLFVVDEGRRVVRAHRAAGADPAAARRFEALEFPLAPEASCVGKAAVTGAPVVVSDVGTTAEPVHLPTAEAVGARSLVALPLRVKDRVFGVLAVTSSAADRFRDADVELLSAVANHVALAVDRAESFRTIEELSRGLEDKVRVRTEQLRTANEALEGAYRDLQATQMQLIQREKMASVGQLVAGVAHELNNPIGFVFSNVTTLEDFVRRLRGMLEVYRALPLPEAERTRAQVEWDGLKVDYALRYLDSMTRGIREGAERARKIVRDLRVFARTQDDVWQAADLHEDLESSLTLVNHLLKDRVAVRRKYGELPAVECVRSQIDQVFLNILANAAQAIPGEGEIAIETRHEDGTAVVRIGDTGPGIPPEVIGRVFDPFFSTKPVGEGTGLGLSISYEIVSRHGGELSAENAPEGGAVFTIRLPVRREAAA